jgi:hypothetical protein
MLILAMLVLLGSARATATQCVRARARARVCLCEFGVHVRVVGGEEYAHLRTVNQPVKAITDSPTLTQSTEMAWRVRQCVSEQPCS